jgi:hypothetical protein
MINLGEEDYNRGTKWVILWKLNLKFEDASGIWTISRAKDNTFPEKQIISLWSSAAVHWRVTLKILKFLLNTTEGHL